MIIFNVANMVNYYDVKRFIEKRKQQFTASRDFLFKKYKILDLEYRDHNLKHYEKFREEYRLVIKSIIVDSITQYRKLLPERCLIYTFGSYAKHTDRIVSDIDLTISYDEDKNILYESAEELIDFTIMNILGYSIDHIHGKFQHYPPMSDFDQFIDNDENHYRLLFDGNFIDYQCGQGTLKENLMHIKNVRDYKSLIDGYKEKYLLKCDIDCLYSIDIIENSTNHNFINDLKILEDSCNICDGYSFDREPTFSSDLIEISFIKKELKKTVVDLYIFISSLRKKVKFFDEYTMTVDDFFKNVQVINFFNGKFIKDLKINYISFIFFWNRLEYTLNKRNIQLSTRSINILYNADLNQYLSSDWKDNTNIEMILSVKNNLQNLILRGEKIIHGEK